MEKHTLNSTWVIWYHINPSDNNWEKVVIENYMNLTLSKKHMYFQNTWQNNLPCCPFVLVFMMKKMDIFFCIFFNGVNCNQPGGCWSFTSAINSQYLKCMVAICFYIIGIILVLHKKRYGH